MVRILDEEAILACTAYFDLNPIRAALAETVETNDFTSVQRRIASLVFKATEDANADGISSGSVGNRPRTDEFLSPIAISNHTTSIFANV